tara:strand:+ start:447 stop:788 length:342 start_codon:yes stop_codon:yes gene_type:complete
MTKLRLGLSISSIRRIFGESDDGFRILTQSLDSIITQRGEFFVKQDAPITADFIETEDTLLTQDGNFIALNQNPLLILILEQDFDTTGNTLETQDAQALITQDGRGILTERVR